MTPLINARQVRFAYPDGTLALDGVDFRLNPGESVALLGPNGSGKTSFVLQLTGLLRGQGQITVCGMRLGKENLAGIRAKVGMVFQAADEQLFLPTVLEDVGFGPRNLGLSPEQAVAEAERALAEVGMERFWNRAPHHLSAGEKRRIALAGVLAMRPEILILDEPTTFLDPPGQRQLLSLLQALPQAKILVTHDTGFARALCTRGVFFEKGRIAAEGSVDELVNRFEWHIGA